MKSVASLTRSYRYSPMRNIESEVLPIYSFAPIADLQSNVLILGTMPGKESLRQNAYYAHNQNAFWKILFTLLNLPFSADYQIRKAMLLKNGVALWDVLAICTRHSSLDADIKKEYPNDLLQFLSSHSNISRIFFNGKGAAGYFKKYFPEINLPYQILPSTSPAHAISWESKLESWKAILNTGNKINKPFSSF